MMKVTFVGLNTGSMGHLVRDSEIIIRRHLNSATAPFPGKNITFFYASNRIANRYFYRMLRTQIRILPFWPFYLFDKILTKASHSYRKRKDTITKIDNTDIEHFGLIPTPLITTSNHSEPINLILEELEISNPYVCLVVRDSGYDIRVDPSNVENQKYRQTPIHDFELSLQLLLDRGYNVVRMGRDSNTSFKETRRGVVDYSHKPLIQSDERDVLLFEHCTFVLTTVSGPDELGSFFRKRLYRVNASPIKNIVISPQYPLTLLSDYIDLESKMKLGWKPIHDMQLDRVGAKELLQDHWVKIQPKDELTIASFIRLVCLWEDKREVDAQKKYLEKFLQDTGLNIFRNGLIY